MQKKRSEVNHLRFLPKRIEKEDLIIQSKQKRIIKIRTEIKDRKSMKLKAGALKRSIKSVKIDQPFTRLRKTREGTQIRDSRNERKDKTIDPKDNKGMLCTIFIPTIQIT